MPPKTSRAAAKPQAGASCCPTSSACAGSAHCSRLQKQLRSRLQPTCVRQRERWFIRTTPYRRRPASGRTRRCGGWYSGWTVQPSSRSGGRYGGKPPPQPRAPRLCSRKARQRMPAWSSPVGKRTVPVRHRGVQLLQGRKRERKNKPLPYMRNRMQYLLLRSPDRRQPEQRQPQPGQSIPAQRIKTSVRSSVHRVEQIQQCRRFRRGLMHHRRDCRRKHCCTAQTGRTAYNTSANWTAEHLYRDGTIRLRGKRRKESKLPRYICSRMTHPVRASSPSAGPLVRALSGQKPGWSSTVQQCKQPKRSSMSGKQ